MDNTTYNPLVSIITVVLNGVKYLEPCIESILKQSYPNIEHVIIDGASTDGTVDVLSSYSIKYPDRIRFISEPDKGGIDAVNKGIRIVKGEILTIVGADDTLEPDAVQSVVELFGRNPNVYYVYGSRNHINEEGDIIKTVHPAAFNYRKAVNGECDIPACATFYRREVIAKIGLYCESSAADIDFLFRAAKMFPIHRIEKVLFNYRVHEGSYTTGSWVTRKEAIRAVCAVCRSYGGSILNLWCIKYSVCVMIDWLRPVLGPIYPFIGKVTGKNLQLK